MRRVRFSLLLPLLPCFAVLLGACDDDGTGPEDVTLDDLAGAWEILSFEFRSVSDPSQSLDLIDDLEGTGTLTIEAAGAFSLELMLPGVPAEASMGELRIENGRLTVIDASDPDPIAFDIDLQGSTLTLVADEGGEFDLDEDGEDEPAIVTLVLRRG